jgi:dihydrofolate synthase/folylpolyglutamate synthase
MNYQQTLEWMFKQLPAFQRIGKAAYKANLDNTYALMDLLGEPHRKFKSIHIAGTNGKGSTAHMLASIFQEAGYKTGLYTSPHLRDFRERIRINGQMIPKHIVQQFIADHQQSFASIKPSFFEMTVGLSFSYFAEEQVDIAIIETGLGGRLDSTNVLNPEMSIITNIGMDHIQFLGDSLEKIAGEKAGIIKKDVPVVIGEHQKESDAVFISKASVVDTQITFAEDDYLAKWTGDQLSIIKNASFLLENINFPLTGIYQDKNVCTAVAAADLLKVPKQLIKVGLENVVCNTSFMGRWQILSHTPFVVCDTAHNFDGLSLVMKQLKAQKYHRLHFVLGVVDDKDIDKIFPLFPKDAAYYFCKANIPRGLAVDELEQQAHKFGLKGVAFSSVAEAFSAAKIACQNDDMVFVGGSTFTVAEVI